MARRWLGPGEFIELVQIGAVRIDPVTFAEIDALEILVRPRVNPVLSDYLQNLTGVTNAALAERGVDFIDAYTRFVAFAREGRAYAFGRDDLVFEANMRLYGIRDAPRAPPYANVIPWLEEYGVKPRGFHASDVARLCGAAFEGRAHDALADARSVALGIKTLVAKGARNPLFTS